MSKSQCQMILDHLKTHHTITPLEALTKYGCFRLAARIADLRSAGYMISTETIEVTGKNGEKHVAQYRMQALHDEARLGLLA